jgi:hypothetical protein
MANGRGINSSRKGSTSELRTLIWLADRGYEAFRNVHPVGPIDVIAIKPGSPPLLLDVKYAADGAPRLDAHQYDMGVLPLYVRPNGSCKIGSPQDRIAAR